MKKKRVCMVVHAYYPADETRVRREADALVRNGFEVDVICLKDVNEKAFEIVNEIKVYRLPVRRHQGSGLIKYMLEYLNFFLLSSIVLLRKFIKKRYDIIQVHNPPDFLVFVTFIPKMFGSKTILDIHDISPELFMSKLKLKSENVVIKILKIMERLSILFASHIITVGEPFAYLLWSRGTLPNKLSIIMNTADPNLFDSQKFQGRESKTKDERFIIIYAGSLHERYGLDTVVKAIHILKSTLPDIQLKIYGRGEAFDELRQLISDLSLNGYVDLGGYIPADNIPQVIANANIGVSPIRKDIFTDLAIPTKVFEYVVMDKPVVVARTSSVESIFDDSAVMFFEPSNEKDLARCILELSRNSKKRAELVRNARKQYEPIKWEAMSQRYVELANSLIKMQ